MKNPLMKCPYCGAGAVLVQDKVVYGHSYGTKLWLCRNYPACDSYVGCHGRTHIPLGRMANKELRAAKVNAHAAFDQLWRNGITNRRNAYALLSQELGIAPRDCHIGMFDVEMCRRVGPACERIKQVLKGEGSHE
jgi:ssDNA-binding Zn-finger/Zn-ribbon topoisomerase 1